MSLVKPNAAITPGFQRERLTLIDGRIQVGRVQSEESGQLVFIPDNGAPETIRSKQIAERIALPSIMPPTDAALLSRAELRDLITFLSSLN